MANIQAVAQYGPVVPVGARPSSQPVSNGTAMQAPPGSSAAASDAPTTDNSVLVDNGLWEGASAGPNCSKCGGGSGPPPDWYTQQGAHFMSRSNPRRNPITLQAPPGGTYAALPIAGAPTSFGVYNNVVTTFTASNGQILRSQTFPTEVLNTKQLGLDVSTGYDMTIGHYWCRDRNNNDHFVEFTFWGLNSWASSRTLAGYMVPIYDETTGPYSLTDAEQINLGQEIPVTTGKFQGSLRTGFPMATPTELPGATDEQKTLSLAFDYATEHAISYRSTLNNFELNGRFSPRSEPDRLVLHPDGKWQRECQPGTYMSYLYGLRLMQIDESLTFHSSGVGPFGNDSTLPVQNAAGDYDVVTHNNLLGLQIGAEMTFRKCRWAWGVEAKLGPYINFANQSSVIDAVALSGTPRPAYNQLLGANAYPAALIGEVGFQATYKFQPNLMGRAAYDFMWISGVALAPEQLQFVANPVDRINANGQIFSQGVSLGLEWMW
jgi:hypothetical protein